MPLTPDRTIGGGRALRLYDHPHVQPSKEQQMQHEDPVATVSRWQDAANRQDIAQLIALSDEQIEIVGPRGSGYGHQLLRDWLARAGLTLATRRIFARGGVVVLAQHGVWRAPETGAVTGEADLASRFRVEQGQVVQFARYETLEAALAEAGLSAADEQTQPATG